MGGRRTGTDDFELLARLAQSGDGAGLTDAALLARCALYLARPEDASARAEFAALAPNLIARASTAALRRAAGSLSGARAVPEAVVEALFAASGAVAAEVAAHFPGLPRRLRAEAAAAEDPRLATAFATRADLSDAEMTALLMRGETAVRRALAGAPQPLPRPVAAALIDAARVDDDLAARLLDRSDLDVAAILPLYRFAAPEKRAAIRAALERRMSERGLSLPDRRATPAEIDALLELAPEGMDGLVAAVARLGQRGEAFARAALQDDSREILALGLLALDIPSEQAVRMLLRTGDAVARDWRALAAPVDILRGGAREAAVAILAANWPRAEALSAPRHEPAMVDGGTPARPAAQGVSQPAASAARTRRVRPPCSTGRATGADLRSAAGTRHARSRSGSPVRSSTSTIHRSESKRISRSIRASTAAASASTISAKRRPGSMSSRDGGAGP